MEKTASTSHALCVPGRREPSCAEQAAKLRAPIARLGPAILPSRPPPRLVRSRSASSACLVHALERAIQSGNQGGDGWISTRMRAQLLAPSYGGNANTRGRLSRGLSTVAGTAVHRVCGVLVCHWERNESAGKTRFLWRRVGCIGLRNLASMRAADASCGILAPCDMSYEHPRRIPAILVLEDPRGSLLR